MSQENDYLDLVELCEDAVEEGRHEEIHQLWDEGNYGFFAKHAIEMSLGMISLSCGNISSQFRVTRDSLCGVSAMCSKGVWTQAT